MMLKAVIFDFDGVIVDSEPLHYRAFVRVIRGYGLELTWEQYIDEYIGYDDRDLFLTFLADSGRMNLIKEDHHLVNLSRQKAEAFEQIVAEGIEITPGLALFFDEVSQQMPTAIASGASRRDIEVVLSKLGWRDRFGMIVSADDVIKSKPNPQTYVLACEALARQHGELKIKPGECLGIEDTTAGLASARGAGLITLGLATRENANELKGADQVIKSFEGLSIAQLRQWFD